MAGVAAAEVAPVEVDEGLQGGERPADAAAPFVRSDPGEGRVAQLLVVGLALAERVVGELEVRRQGAIEEQRRADPGAERDHHLEALAGHDGHALQVGVVGHPGRPTEPGADRPGEVEAAPGLAERRHDRRARAVLGDEVGSRDDVALADDAGEADRDAVVRGQRGDQARDDVDEARRLERVGRRHPDPVGGHVVRRVEHRGLDAGAAHVDGERERPWRRLGPGRRVLDAAHAGIALAAGEAAAGEPRGS